VALIESPFWFKTFDLTEILKSMHSVANRAPSSDFVVQSASLSQMFATRRVASGLRPVHYA
jgi:hypothetical protein